MPSSDRPPRGGRQVQRDLLSRGVAATPSVPDIRVELEGQPLLPEGAAHYLLPKFLWRNGRGIPKGVWLESLGQRFLVWWRAWGTYTEGHVGATLYLPYWNTRTRSYYRNPWRTYDEMRRFCEACPNVEVVERQDKRGIIKPICRLKRGVTGDSLPSGDCPDWPESPGREPPREGEEKPDPGRTSGSGSAEGGSGAPSGQDTPGPAAGGGCAAVATLALATPVGGERGGVVSVPEPHLTENAEHWTRRCQRGLFPIVDRRPAAMARSLSSAAGGPLGRFRDPFRCGFSHANLERLRAGILRFELGQSQRAPA